ncbi:MAG TPA: hypothetical protein VIJ75_06140 [Hanamia sp.]
MSDCNFTLPFNGSPLKAIEKARAAIEGQNGNFTGDETAGNFDVSIYGNTIKGYYNVTGQILNLVITEKPFFVPCSTIESLLSKQIL